MISSRNPGRKRSILSWVFVQSVLCSSVCCNPGGERILTEFITRRIFFRDSGTASYYARMSDITYIDTG